MEAYQKTLPELKASFEELMRDWENRMGDEEPDLSFNRSNAVKVVASILFLTDIWSKGMNEY